MKIHNLWLLVAMAVATHATFFNLSAFQAVGGFFFTCFCILFWYLGEIRVLLQAIKDEKHGQA